MILETVEAKGLSHLSYVVGDERAGVCAVVDPRRDVDVYLDLARGHDVRITHILETHIHADFVSGSRELEARTGAPIYVGAADEYGFEHRALRDGDTLDVGPLTFRTLHTPGHTPEHVCFLVSGGKGAQEPWGLFSGDTLFAGEVGRPDLIGGGTEERLARQLYHSFQDRILTLSDGVVVYPAHGEGSPCGGSIGDRKTTSIGYERLHNPKLQAKDEDEFVRMVLADLPPAPFYYPRMKKVNAQGPKVLGALPDIPSMSPDEFERAMGEESAIVVDAREIEAFGGAHIAGALNIALREEFPIWAGWVLKPEQHFLLVPPDAADIDEIRWHMLRIGLEEFCGSLRQGMRGWLEAGKRFDTTPQMSVHELKERVVDGRDGVQMLDVRRDDEWKSGHIPDSVHTFVPYLPDRLDIVDRTKPVAVYCGSGYRASLAASMLQREGFSDVRSVPGSMAAWNAAGFPTEKPDGEGAG